MTLVDRDAVAADRLRRLAVEVLGGKDGDRRRMGGKGEGGGNEHAKK